MGTEEAYGLRVAVEFGERLRSESRQRASAALPVGMVSNLKVGLMLVLPAARDVASPGRALAHA